MKQLGNSVAIPAIQSVAKNMIEYIKSAKVSQKTQANKALVTKLQTV